MGLDINQRVKLISKDGKHFLQMPDGAIIPGLVWTRVYDGIDEGDSYLIANIQIEIIDKPLDIK